MLNGTNEIRAAAENFLRAFDDLDWERFEACWASNPTVFFPGEDTRFDGRAAVLTRFRTVFDQILQRSSGPPYLGLQPLNLRADRLGDAGLVTFTLGGKSGPQPRRSLLFVKESGGWKLAHLHASN